MRKLIIAAAIVGTLPLAACSDYGSDRPGYASQRHDRNYNRGRGDRNRDYVLNNNDHIYRDRDGSYYCKRPDGTKGAIIGGLAGGVLGNVIAPDGSKTLGSVIGAVGGAVAGRAVERGEVRCR